MRGVVLQPYMLFKHSLYYRCGTTTFQHQCIRSCGQDDGFFLRPKLKSHNLPNLIPDIIEPHILPWQTPSAFGIPYDCIEYFLGYGRILSSSNGFLLAQRRRFGEYNIEFRLYNPANMVYTVPLRTPNKGFKFIVNEDVRPLIECYPWAHGAVDGVEFLDDYIVALPIKCWSDYNVEIHHLIYSDGSWEEELCNVSIEGRVVRYDMPVAVFLATTRGLIIFYIPLIRNDTYYYTDL